MDRLARAIRPTTLSDVGFVIPWHQRLSVRMLGGIVVANVVTPNNLVITAILAAGLPVLAWRFIAGLGATTNLSQTVPWGLWIGAAGAAPAHAPGCAKTSHIPVSNRVFRNSPLDTLPRP